MRYHEYILYRLKQEREPKPRHHQPSTEEGPMAKPKEITKKGNKYKVTLDIRGKKCHIGYTKTLEQALELLEQSRKDVGYEDE